MQRMIELRLGTYHLIKELDRGASGTVYLASAISGPYQEEIHPIRTGATHDPADPIEENQTQHRPFPFESILEFGNFEAEGEFLPQANFQNSRRDSFLIPEEIQPEMEPRRSKMSEIEAPTSLFAIKEVIVENDKPDQRKKQREFIQQLKILQQLNHPGIIRVEDYSNLSTIQDVFPKKLYLAIEYGSCGNLLRLINKVKEMDQYRQKKASIFAYYAAQMVHIIDYLQSSGVIHRDIKAENFILDDKYKLKLIDFGVAEASDSSKIALEGQEPFELDRGKIGSPHFISPEMIERSRNLSTKQQCLKTDLWSLGVLLYCMWTGTFPFVGSNSYYLGVAIKRDQPDYSRLPKNQKLRTLIRSLLQKRQEQRWGIEEVKKCQYFRSFNLDKIFQVESPIVTILNKQEKDHIFREEVIFRVQQEAKRRIVGLIRRKIVKEESHIDSRRPEANLNIKKIVSSNTEINSDKKIESYSYIEPPHLFAPEFPSQFMIQFVPQQVPQLTSHQVLLDVPQLPPHIPHLPHLTSQLVKRYLTIARIKSRVMPKQIQIQESTRLQVKESESKVLLTFAEANQSYPFQVQIQFLSEQHLNSFVEAYQKLFE